VPRYLNYVTPGILLMTVAAAVQGTAIVVAMDMTGGIIDRFRTMAIARSAVLTGHVLASLIQTILSIGIVLGVAVALGFRPQAGVLDWLASIGLLTLFAFALIWLATALGLAAKSVETASNTPMFLTLLPFLGSGFVLLASMPTGLRQFAHYQPFTPTTETLRTPHRNPDRRERRSRRRLERRHRPRRLPLGQTPLHPQALGLTRAARAQADSPSDRREGETGRQSQVHRRVTLDYKQTPCLRATHI
jgi:ABC-2 type transporter